MRLAPSPHRRFESAFPNAETFGKVGENVAGLHGTEVLHFSGNVYFHECPSPLRYPVVLPLMVRATTTHPDMLFSHVGWSFLTENARFAGHAADTQIRGIKTR